LKIYRVLGSTGCLNHAAQPTRRLAEHNHDFRLRARAHRISLWGTVLGCRALRVPGAKAKKPKSLFAAFTTFARQLSQMFMVSGGL
jgi:hypothetical protein